MNTRRQQLDHERYMANREERLRKSKEYRNIHKEEIKQKRRERVLREMLKK